MKDDAVAIIFFIAFILFQVISWWLLTFIFTEIVTDVWIIVQAVALGSILIRYLNYREKKQKPGKKDI